MQAWDTLHHHHAAAAAQYGCFPGSYLPLHHYPHHPAAPSTAALTVHNKSILELRKEKSRDAARSRRGKENYEFYELAKMLPLPAAITSQLDKASIIRLTISYLKLRDFSAHGDPPWNRDGPPPNKAVKGGPPRRRSMTAVAMEIFETHQGTHVLQSIDGFLFALSNDGRFLYISETVSIYLGLSQVEMTGSSLFDYVHVQDHVELAEQLGLVLPSAAGSMPSPGSASDEGSSSSTPRAVTPPIPERAIMNPNPSKGYDRSFCIRMKSTLTKRGVHVKCSGYRVVQILGRMRPQFSFSLTRKHPPPLLGLVGMAVALPPPTISELLIDSDMFVTRLSPQFKVIYCEPRISDLMDITADDFTNRNLYDYCHAEDLQKIRKSHVDLLNKGQVLTEYYRLLNKHGGYVWVQTCATVICNAKNAEDQNIIAINYVLSGIEYGGCVMDIDQLKMATGTEPDQSDHSESEAGSDHEDKKEEREQRTPRNPGGTEDPGERRGSKRKHSSGEDDQGSAQDMVESGSPENNLGMLETSLNNHHHLYSDPKTFNSTDRVKTVDTKNSRRKMDRPRKRKRESDSDPDVVDGVLEVENSNNIDSLLGGTQADAARDGGAVCTRTEPSPPGGTSVLHTLKSPAPEDLSVRTATPITPNAHPQSSNTPNTNSSTGTGAESVADKWHVGSSSSASDSGVGGGGSTGTSSVRDLEEVMNKHLPPSLPADHLHQDYHNSLSFHHKHKSAIQWIGSQHTSNGEQLPASQLLRTLYANRESVIRTNVYNPRPQYTSSYPTPELQPSLLTPPAQDSYSTSSSTSQQVTPTPKTPPSTYSLMSPYTHNPISVADSYSMTPPSSVSPQDKYTLPFVDQCHSEAQYRAYGSEGASHLPIKPQAYPLPAHNAHMSTYERSAAAQYTAAGYYGHGTAYPAYNSSPTPAHYRDVTKNGNVW